MICMLWLWKAVWWWWWDVSGAVDKLRYHPPFIWQSTLTYHPVRLRTIWMFIFLFVFIFVFTGWREVVVVTLLESEWRRMVEHPRSGNDDGDASSDAGSDSYWGKGMTPHGKWVFSVFPLAVTGVGGGTVTLSSSLLPLSLLLLLLSLSADVIFAVFILRFHRCYCYLRRFQFSFS